MPHSFAGDPSDDAEHMGLFTPSAETADKERWLKLESVVSNGLRNFQLLGNALKEIRDQQLYRFEYETFDECCTLRWRISARHATRLIVAFETAQEIGPAGSELSERQLRPLGALPIEQRRDAFEEAQEGGVTTASIEKAVAKRRRKILKNAPLKKLRLRVPGGTIVIEPNRHATTHEQMLLDALKKYQQRAEAA